MIPSLLNQAKLIWACEPKNYSGIAATAKWVSLKNYGRLYIWIITGVMAAAAAVTVRQSTVVAGTSSKAVTFTEFYHDETTSGTLVKETCSSTFDIDTANKQYIIPIDPAQLDVGNGFDCVTVAVASPGVAIDIYSVAYILFQPRNAEDTPLTALLD